METSLFNRLQATLLAVATVGLFLLAALNLVEERHYQQPVDGVWWREASGGLEADKVLPDSPGQRAGIQAHDLLTGAQVLPDNPAQRADTDELLPGVQPLPEESPKRTDQAGMEAKQLLPKANYATITRVSDLERVLYRTQIYGKAGYQITRDGIPLETPVVVIPEPLDRSLAHGVARHRPHLPGHRNLRSFPPLDSAPRHPLLPLLPGFVCSLRAQIHRQLRYAGLDRLLVQCTG